MAPASYQNALYLNNAGVALLERGCYQQAAETLVDAAATMKLVASKPIMIHDAKNEQFEPATQETKSKIEKAAKRLALSSNVQTGVTTKVIKCVASSDLEGLDISFSTKTLPPHIVSSVDDMLTPIRIDSTESLLADTVDLKALTMVYNLSLAYRALAATSPEPEAAFRLRGGAMKLALRSYCALTSQCTSEWSDWYSVAMLTIALLRNLMTLAIELGQIGTALEYHSRLCEAEIVGLWISERTGSTKYAAAA